MYVIIPSSFPDEESKQLIAFHQYLLIIIRMKTVRTIFGEMSPEG